jgi:uncharacterized protein
MPWPTAKRAIDFLFEGAAKCTGRDRAVEISFWGGEPLLKWELLKKTALYARDVSKRTAIPVQFGGTTNGTLLTSEKFDFLDEIGCKFLVSFDGTPDTHNYYRKFRVSGEGSQELIRKNMEAVLKRWPDYRPRSSAFAERVEYFFDDMKYLWDMGFSYLVFSPVYESAWTPEKWVTFEEQCKKVIDYMVELRKTGRKNIDIQHFKAYCGVDNSLYPCGAGRFYVGIDIDGSIYPCHRFNKFNDDRPWQEKEVCIGHIDHGITRPEFRKYFVDWDHKCGSCARLYDTPCHGGCYATRFDLTGNRMDVPCKEICTYVEVQRRVSQYYKEKLNMPTETGITKSCICNNLCYAENTPGQIITRDPNSDMTCICYNTAYDGPLEPQSRPLEKVQPGFTQEDRNSLKTIFQDIDRRLSEIEKKLGEK